MDTIIQIINEHLGGFIAILVVLVIALIAGAWWASQIYYKIKNLPCSRVEKNVEYHDGRIRDTERTLGKIEGMVESIYRLMIVKNQSNDLAMDINDVSQKHSPRTLNENGKNLFIEVDGQDFLNKNKNFLFGEIDVFEPKTALDVENISFNILRLKSTDKRFNSIKNFVYNAPTREMVDSEGNTQKKDVTLDMVLFVLSIPLRDMYLAEHPEILE